MKMGAETKTPSYVKRMSYDSTMHSKRMIEKTN